MDQKWPSLVLMWVDLSPYWPFLSLEEPPEDGAADADGLKSSGFFWWQGCGGLTWEVVGEGRLRLTSENLGLRKDLCLWRMQSPL